MEETRLDRNIIYEFPPPRPRGKVFAGVCCWTDELTPQLLYSALMQGVFPWFNEDEGEPVIWHSPDPRFCIKIEDFHVPSRLARFIKHNPFTFTMDECFERVMRECRQAKRENQNGSWIGEKMIEATVALHEEGIAHSVEVWHGDDLVGGFYGELLGSVFCGESMFTKESESSKCAFVLFERAFEKCGGKLIDSQVYTDNIARYGARNISRDAFLHLEREYIQTELVGSLKDTFLEIASNTQAASGS